MRFGHHLGCGRAAREAHFVVLGVAQCHPYRTLISATIHSAACSRNFCLFSFSYFILGMTAAAAVCLRDYPPVTQINEHATRLRATVRARRERPDTGNGDELK